jgi:hypothetical protein
MPQPIIDAMSHGVQLWTSQAPPSLSSRTDRVLLGIRVAMLTVLLMCIVNKPFESST